MDTTADRHFLDTWIARLIVGLIGLAALAAIWGVYNVQTGASSTATSPGAGLGTAAATNPAFVQCRDQRTAEIDRMLSEGLIDEARHEEFTRRAIQTCAGQFPPDG
jgi:hypothetical protein